MFTTLIVQPLFNLLVLIFALLPRHNFGAAIIVFTIVIRLLMWPLVKKQLRNAKVMRDLQPQLKQIKKSANGDRQKESTMVMELYKEKGVNPFSSLGIVILQIPILFGLYSGLRRIVADPKNIYLFAYPFVQNLPFVKELAGNIGKFDHTLFGIVDLTKPALMPGGGIYWPAMILVLGSAIAQFYQSKQLLPSSKDSRKLRDILRDAGKGKSSDQTEVNAAVGRSTQYIIPVMIFFFTVNIASALSLYWLVSGLVAVIQQARVLRSDETEMEESLDDAPNGSGADPTANGGKSGKPGKDSKKKRTIIEGEVVVSSSSETKKAAAAAKAADKPEVKTTKKPTPKKGKKKQRRR